MYIRTLFAKKKTKRFKEQVCRMFSEKNVAQIQGRNVAQFEK